MAREASRRYWLLPVLGLMGLVLAAWQPVTLAELLDWGERITDRPLVIILIVVVVALLFTFGLPGSLGLWLIAPFQPPLEATLLLVVASVLGAAGAYLFAGHLHRDWQPGAFGARVIALLASRSDLLTQIALRVLPGFPHSVVNFAGGVLRLPLAGFLVAAVIGLGVKWAVYASAVHGLTDSLEAGAAVDAQTLLPLLVLTVMLLVGAWARRRLGG